MTNKKLNSVDEEDIYMKRLTGKSLTNISKEYSVVPSTIQRIVKKKSSIDPSPNNFIVSNMFKKLGNAITPFELVVKSFETYNIELHRIQKEAFQEMLESLSQSISKLSEIVKTDIGKNSTDDSSSLKNS